MLINKWAFSIAGLNFLYLYHDPIEIADHTPYTSFSYSGKRFDAINNICVVKSLPYIELPNKYILQKSPSWTIYESNKQHRVVMFHPNNTNIGYILSDNNWTVCHTTVIEGFTTSQLLPVSMTGFLCQQKFQQKGENSIFMHGATISVRGKNIVLTGNSGVGKSTLAGLFRMSEKSVCISDDRFILRRHNDFYYAYGNPFDMKNTDCKNTNVKIDSVYFLHHSLENKIINVAVLDRMKKLIKVAMLSYFNPDMIKEQIHLLGEFAKHTNVYDLYFYPDIESCRCILQNERCCYS